MRTHGDLVDEEPPATDEELDGEHAHHIEVVGEEAGHLGRAASQCIGDRRRELDHRADPVLLDGAHHGIGEDLPVDGADDLHRHLGIDRDLRLDEELPIPEDATGDQSVELLHMIDHMHTAPVVPTGGVLHHDGKREPVHRSTKL